MHRTLAVIVMILLPAVAVAQSPVPAPGAPAALPPIGLPLPPIGLPLPAIGLPLPSIGLPAAADTQPALGHDRGGPENQHPQFGSRRSVRSAPTLIYLIPTYGWAYPPPAQSATPGAIAPDPPSIPRQQESRTGRLRLDVQPDRELQLYVDGYYVGTPGDFNGELELEAGAHRIEIRASGYETAAFDVKIDPGRSITYRGALKPVDAAAAPAVTPDTTSVTAQPGTPATPTTFYYIPGCYIGNVPPADVVLPATCDLSRLIIRKP